MYRLTNFDLTISVLDCAAPTLILPSTRPRCDVVAQPTVYVFMNVPPGQVRELSEPITLPSQTRIGGDFQWNYRVI
jgi:hypothetical protein